MATVPNSVYEPAEYACDTGREFNPASEAHHFCFSVKMVDPGCTLEIQVEERDGRVSRLTTTEIPEHDNAAIRALINGAVDRMLAAWKL